MKNWWRFASAALVAVVLAVGLVKAAEIQDVEPVDASNTARWPEG